MTLAIGHPPHLPIDKFWATQGIEDSEQGVGERFLMWIVNLPLLADMLSGGGVVALKC